MFFFLPVVPAKAQLLRKTRRHVRLRHDVSIYLFSISGKYRRLSRTCCTRKYTRKNSRPHIRIRIYTMQWGRDTGYYIFGYYITSVTIVSYAIDIYAASWEFNKMRIGFTVASRLTRYTRALISENTSGERVSQMNYGVILPRAK